MRIKNLFAQVFALYNASLVLLAQTADQTAAAAFAANTCLRLPLQTAVTIPATGLYYLGFLVVHGGGSPTLLNCLVPTNANAMGLIAGMTPILAATSTAGIATGVAPNPAGALTAIVNCLYAFVD